MMRRLILPILLSACVMGAASCSKDEIPGDPDGTAILNMYNEENGRTLLSDSDIYIDNAGNFVSPSSCQLFMLGRLSGLGAVRASTLKNPAPQVAVKTGYGYVAVRGAAVRRFPSQATAMSLDPDLGVNYLKFYVTELLEDASENSLGAVVKFTVAQPRNYWLPAWGSTPYVLDCTSKALGDTVSVTLPGDDFEADFDGQGYLSCEKQGRRLVFRLLDWPVRGGGYTHRATLRLRVGESYTEVRVEFLY